MIKVFTKFQFSAYFRKIENNLAYPPVMFSVYAVAVPLYPGDLLGVKVTVPMWSCSPSVSSSNTAILTTN